MESNSITFTFLYLLASSIASVYSQNLTNSRYRYAPAFDGKEIQPRQMQFLQWLFGDPNPHRNTNSADNKIHAVNLTTQKPTNSLLSQANRTKLSAKPDALPIDWSQVLKEFVNPIHSNAANQLAPIYNETRASSDTIKHSRFNHTDSGVKVKINSTRRARNGKQFYSKFYPFRPNHKYGHGQRGSIHRRWQVPHSRKSWYQNRRYPVYNIYNGDEERNGFDELGEANDSEIEYYDTLQRPYPKRKFNWRDIRSFYKNMMLNRFMEDSMRRPVEGHVGLPIEKSPVRRKSADEAVRYYDDYDTVSIEIERPVDEKHGEGWEEEDVEEDSYEVEPDTPVRRSFPAKTASKPWGRNCNGTQCGRQGIPVTSSNSSVANTTVAGTNVSNAATVSSAINGTTVSTPVLTNATSTAATPLNNSNVANSTTAISAGAINSTSSTPSPSITSSSTVTPTPTINTNTTIPVGILPAGNVSTTSPTIPVLNSTAGSINSSTLFPVLGSTPAALSNNSTSQTSVTPASSSPTPSSTSATTAALTNTNHSSNTMQNSTSSSSTTGSTGNSSVSSNSTEEMPPMPPMSATLNCQCGVQSITGESAGSVVVRAMANPWLVEIHTRSEHLCAGTFINNKYVLTSAKCVKNRDKKTLLVTGGLQLNDLTTFAVTKVAIHPKFDEVTLDHDIALLRIEDAIKPSQAMRPICLPVHDRTHSCHTGQLVTWVHKGNARGKQLHMLQSGVELLNHTTCQALVTESGDNTIVSSGAICASPAGKKNCLGGDVGGPLEVYSGKYSYEQIGLVSWSIGCRSTNFPGVYTDIRHYLRWILFQTQDSDYCREPRTRSDQMDPEDPYRFEQIM